MSEIYGPFLSDIENRPTQPKRKGWAWLSWFVIVGLCGFIVWQAMQANERRRERKEDRLSDAMFRMQARYLIGGANTDIVGQSMSGQSAYGAAKKLDHGPVGQRQEFAVIAGELVGPEKALEHLERLARDAQKFDVELSADEKKTQDILNRVYADYRQLRWQTPSVNAKERETLKERLSWFGELAVTPKHIHWKEQVVAPAAGAPAAIRLADPLPDNAGERAEVLQPARRTFLLLFGLTLVAILAGGLGLVGLVAWFVVLGLGKIRLRFETGTSHSGVYAETFAVWLLLFFGGSFAMRWLELPISRELTAGLMMLGSLIVLAWPVVRGISWRQVRQDIGWTKGRSAGLESVFGVMCYAMTLPLVAVGAIVVLIFMQILQFFAASGGAAGNPFERSGMPAHPVVEYLAFGTFWDWLLILWLAAVVAPIVEETMFRGVLHRQMREATGRWSRFWSVAFSSTLIGFLFAVVHPEGLIAVPVKMGLAYGFTLAREWRGSLIPAMVGHGLNNAMATLLVFVLFK